MEILISSRKLARGCEDEHMTQQPHDAYADLAPSVGDRLRIARERRAKLSQGGVDVEWLARPEVFETLTF